MKWRKISNEMVARATTLLIGVCAFVLIIEFLRLRHGTPSVLEILAATSRLLCDPTFYHDLKVSLARWLIGWSIGISIGLVFGILTGRSKFWGTALEGFMILARGLPYVAMLPLMARLYGLSEMGKFVLLAWVSASISWVSIHEGAKTVSPYLLWRAKNLSTTIMRRFRRIILYGCAAGIRAGMRASLLLCLLAVAVAELGGVYESSPDLWWSGGIGHRLFTAGNNSEDAEMMALMLCFLILGFLAEGIFELLWALGRQGFYQRDRLICYLAKRKYHGRDFQLNPGLKEPAKLSVEKLSVKYGETEIISDLSFNVEHGETLALIGPSGCGKTTLVRALAGYNKGLTVSGNITVDGVNRDSKKVSGLMQESLIFPGCTVWTNLLFSGRLDRSRGDSNYMAEAWSLLSEFGMKDYYNVLVEKLSAGQKQRIGLMISVIDHANVLALDEPFANLDAITRREAQQFFLDHIKSRRTAVFVTHDLDEAILLGDSIMVGIGSDAKIYRKKEECIGHSQEQNDRQKSLKEKLTLDLQKETARIEQSLSQAREDALQTGRA